MRSLPPIPEHDIQANFFREANYEFRNEPTWIPELFYAVLHGAWLAGDDKEEGEKGKGNSRKNKLIAKYKAEGWKRGIPDMHYDQPRGPYSKLIIEFKRADRRNNKNGGLSDDQLVYMNAIAPYALVAVCYSEDEAIGAMRGYMQLPDSRVSWAILRAESFHRTFHHDRSACEICKDAPLYGPSPLEDVVSTLIKMDKVNEKFRRTDK